MKRRIRTLLCIWTSCIGAAAHAQSAYEPDQPQRAQAQLATQAASVTAYWTPERMRQAKPMPTPARVIRASELAASSALDDGLAAAGAEPGYANGCRPGAENCRSVEHVISPDNALYAEMIGLAQPQHGAKPTNPLNGPYGPFQRWSEHEAHYGVSEIDDRQAVLHVCPARQFRLLRFRDQSQHSHHRGTLQLRRQRHAGHETPVLPELEGRTESGARLLDGHQ